MAAYRRLEKEKFKPPLGAVCVERKLDLGVQIFLVTRRYEAEKKQAR